MSAQVQTSAAGRRRAPRRVARSRVVATATSVLLVAAAMIGYRFSENTVRYQLTTTQLDHPVAFGSGRVVVSDVRTAHELKERDDVTTSVGLFLVVRVTVQATGREKVTVADSELEAGGRTYTPVETGASLVTASPGFESSGDFVFEVDPSSLAEATLRVWAGGFVTRYEQRIQTPLGITSANAGRWVSAGDRSRLALETAETRALP